MEQAELERLQRRYPWSKYKDVPKPPFMSREENHAFAVKHWVARVTWVVPDSSPGMYGWRYETRTFDNVETALEIAKQPMGIARSVEVDRFNWDVPHGHKDRCVSLYRRKNAALAKGRASK
jgi:hypothetical protein